MAAPRKAFAAKLPLVSLLITLALIAGMVGYWWLSVRPWLAPPPKSPEEIERLWLPVAAAARLSSTAAAGEEARLLSALEILAAQPREALESAVAQWQKGEALADGERVALRAAGPAVARLAEWNERAGGLGAAEPCGVEERFRATDLLLLGRVALARRDHADDGPGHRALLFAVARLAAAMRGAGGPVLLVAGVRLAEDLLVAARRHDMVAVLTEPDIARPDEEDVWRALNAEAACVDEMLDKHFVDWDQSWPLRVPAAREVPQAWFSPDAGYLQRERLMVRLWWGERLARAAAVRRDPRALGEALRFEREALPRSLLVRVVAVDLAEPMTEALRAVQAYHEALRREALP